MRLVPCIKEKAPVNDRSLKLK